MRAPPHHSPVITTPPGRTNETACCRKLALDNEPFFPPKKKNTNDSKTGQRMGRCSKKQQQKTAPKRYTLSLKRWKPSRTRWYHTQTFVYWVDRPRRYRQYVVAIATKKHTQFDAAHVTQTPHQARASCSHSVRFGLVNPRISSSPVQNVTLCSIKLRT